MPLFNNKKTEEAKKESAKAPAAEEKKGPSIHNVKVPAAKAETKAAAKDAAKKAAPAKKSRKQSFCCKSG